MTTKLRTRKIARALALCGFSTLAGGTTIMGCLNRPIEPVDPRTTSTIVERITQTAVDKIDILLAIDNSASMADKQQILAEAVPDLVNRLVNPDCVSKDLTQRQTVATPTDACPEGLEREFDPILDINIGIVSSSLGMATVCTPTSATNPNNNDQAHLLHRSSPTANDDIPTFNNAGFLAWDPGNKRGGETSVTNLQDTVSDMVIGTGQVGCGYEMQLESIYRFLAEPSPKVWEWSGTAWAKSENEDTVLLDQRKQFMRSNSLLAVVILSDENDCSVSDPVILNTTPFYKAADQCKTDPNDACCTSCFFAIRDGAPEGCDLTSMKCDENSDGKADAYAEDKAELKCGKQKENYGYNFLFPTARYVNAFTQFQIDPSKTDVSPVDSKNAVANPIFTDLSGTGQPTRSQDLVFIAGIVGVPFDVVAKKNDQGVTESFKTFDELTADGFWDAYVGDPDGAIPPTNAIMVESIDARAGIASDRTIMPRTDYQYACYFTLPMARPGGADCGDNEANDPLCNPAMNSEQVAAKGYPGTRELAFLRGLGGQGIVASVCPENTTDKNALNYGYRPAVNAIIERLKTALGGQCLPRKLLPDPQGNIPCLVLEASTNADGPKSGTDLDAAKKVISSSSCAADQGRAKVPEGREGAVLAALVDPLSPKVDGVPVWNNFCAVQQLLGDDRTACQTQEQVASAINGWCYVSNDVGEVQGCAQYSGEAFDGCAAQVENCPASEKHIIRFVNKGEAQAGATQLITCSGDSAN